MPPKKRTKRRGSQERERMSMRARSPAMDELSFVPETQQSQQDGVEELVVGVMDPVEMSDTEQGDIGLGTQHDLDTSDEDTQAARGTQSGKGKDKGKADKRSKKPPVLFTTEQEQKIVDFLRDRLREILYNKCLMDYKDRSKREAVWDKFCEENNLNKDRETHTCEVQPGGTSVDIEAEMDQRQF